MRGLAAFFLFSLLGLIQSSAEIITVTPGGGGGFVSGSASGCAATAEVLYSNGATVACSTAMLYTNPNTATGSLTFDLGANARQTSNVPILGNNSIVIKNSALGTGSINIFNNGNTTQSGAATLSIRGGSDGSQQIFTNLSWVWPAVWAAGTTYTKGMVAAGSNGTTYTCKQVTCAAGDNPVTDGGVNWQTKVGGATVAANGVNVYDNPAFGWNGIELGESGLQLWAGPPSTGLIGGETEQPVGAFMINAYNAGLGFVKTDFYSITEFHLGVSYDSGATFTQTVGPAAQIVITNADQPIWKGQAATGAILEALSQSGDAEIGTVNNFPLCFFINNGACRITINGTTGTVSINTITSDATHTDSTVCQDTTTHALYAGSGAAGICLGTSGVQFKTDFAPMTEGIAELMRINFQHWRFRPGHGDDGVRMQWGPTAQDVEAVLPGIVGHDENGETINYDFGALWMLTARALQQVKNEFDSYVRAHP